MRIKKYITLLFITALIIITIFAVGNFAKTTIPVVNIFNVIKSKSDEIVQSTGKVGYINQKNVKANYDCVVTDIFIKENDNVKKNDEILKVAVVEFNGSCCTR